MTAPAAAPSRRTARLAGTLHCTEGQLYTMVVGVLVAVVLALSGVPPAMRAKAGSDGSTGNLPALASAPPPPPAATTADPVAASPVAAPFTPSPQVVATPSAVPAPTATYTPPATTTSASSPPPAGSVATWTAVPSPGAPGGVALAPDGTVYVTTDNGTARGKAGPSHVFAFAPDATPGADVTVTGQPSGHADGLTGAAVDANGAVVVLDAATARILAVDPKAGSVREMARLIDLAPCLVALAAKPCEPGVQDHKPFPAAAAFDHHGNLFVSDPAQGTIWRLRPGQKNPEAWLSSSDYGTGDGPAGLAFDPDGRLNFTVGSALATDNPGVGALYRVDVKADGTAGAPTRVVAFARGDEPGALAVGASGNAYLVLRGSGAIVAVGPNGAEVSRVVPPGNGNVPIDGPAALVVGDHRLLVANQSSGNVASHWAVLEVGVNDTPVA